MSLPVSKRREIEIWVHQDLREESWTEKYFFEWVLIGLKKKTDGVNDISHVK